MAERTCSVTGCDRRHKALGYCSLHYLRYRTHGDPLHEPFSHVQRTLRRCSVSGCEMKHKAYGYCHVHAQRWLRRGTAELAPPHPPAADRFWARVDKSGDCWLWTGSTHKDGYGSFATNSQIGKRATMAAHRYAWSLTNGEIPAGKFVKQTCGTRSCVRPDHLRLVDSKRDVLGKRGTVTPGGYRRIFMPEHPNADNNGRLFEHVVVMTEKLGRPLRPGENVHHMNGVRTDNRPENLELWVTSQPKGQRPADLVEWAREILDRYEEESIRVL